MTGNLSYALRDRLDLERPGSALGVDCRSRVAGRVLGTEMRPVLGCSSTRTRRLRGR